MAATTLRTRLHTFRAGVADVVRHAWAALRHLYTKVAGVGVRIEVLVSDRARQRTVCRQLDGAVRKLHHLAPIPVPVAIVITHQVLTNGRELAGGTHVRTREDGSQTALIRAALRAGGRSLGDDEVLAAVAEQWIGLATQYGGQSVLVPLEAPLSPAPGTTDGAAADHHEPFDGADPLVQPGVRAQRSRPGQACPWLEEGRNGHATPFAGRGGAA